MPKPEANLASKVVDTIEEWITNGVHFKFFAHDAVDELSSSIESQEFDAQFLGSWLANAVTDKTKSEAEQRQHLFRHFSCIGEAQPQGVLNCYWFLIFTGFISGTISLEQLENFVSHLLYVLHDSCFGDDEGWDMELFTSGEIKKYVDETSPIPKRGDFVIFDSIRYHVAIATGKIAEDGSPEILHFWSNDNSKAPTSSSIKKALAMSSFTEDPSKIYGGTFFAAPPWTNRYFNTRRSLIDTIHEHQRALKLRGNSSQISMEGVDARPITLATTPTMFTPTPFTTASQTNSILFKTDHQPL
jgi:hypothetical protein